MSRTEREERARRLGISVTKRARRPRISEPVTVTVTLEPHEVGELAQVLPTPLWSKLREAIVRAGKSRQLLRGARDGSTSAG